MFTQLLQNLIGNALKYTEQGYVRISQGIESDALVLDDRGFRGRAYPDDKLERIFDEYYQIGPQGTQRLGVGLGLAIVREVSPLAGLFGRGCLDSWARVPASAFAYPGIVCWPPPQAPAPKVADVPVQMPQSGCRLLLLEDNDSVRMATELFLTPRRI